MKSTFSFFSLWGLTRSTVHLVIRSPERLKAEVSGCCCPFSELQVHCLYSDSPGQFPPAVSDSQSYHWELSYLIPEKKRRALKETEQSQKSKNARKLGPVKILIKRGTKEIGPYFFNKCEQWAMEQICTAPWSQVTCYVQDRYTVHRSLHIWQDLWLIGIRYSLGCLLIWKNFPLFQSLKWSVCRRRLRIPTCIEPSCDFLRRREKPLPTCSLIWPDCFNSVFFAALINQEKALLQIQSSEMRYSVPCPCPGLLISGEKVDIWGDFFVSLCSSKLFETFRLSLF